MHTRMSAGSAAFADLQFAVSRFPRVLVQCVAVNIRFYLSYLNDVQEMFSFARRHVPHLTNMLFI
jgi:hypothetical protein